MSNKDKQIIEKLRAYDEAWHGSTVFGYAADRLEELLGKPKPAPEGCVTVRIAVAVNEHGEAAAKVIKSGQSDRYPLADIAKSLTHPFRDVAITHRGILVGDVPVCKVPVIPGTVEEPSCSTDSANS